MAEITILLAMKKIGIALSNGVADKASMQFAKYRTHLLELLGSMGRVMGELRVIDDVFCEDTENYNSLVYESWLEEIQNVAHVTENMVDEYLHLVGREQDIGCCFHLMSRFKKPRSVLSLNRIVSGMKKIEIDLVHLLRAKSRWAPVINSSDYGSSNYVIMKSQHLAAISRTLDEEDLVVVDKCREKLEQWLASDDLERSVIALHGMGGLGKTSLAAYVYRKERDKFQCHAWVSISQIYSKEDVLRNLIMELFKHEDIFPDNIAAMDITCLEQTLKKFLEQRKYLIILDDIWTPEAFDFLSRALIHNDKGSRLIITTREGDVATLASRGHILTLETFSEDKAWGLFCKKVFPRDTNHDCPAELKPLSMEIVNKCKGLPLVIVSVASLLLLHEKTVEEFRRINDQFGWELMNNARLSYARNILHLSFTYLPTHLKGCFLYCSLFPENYLFKRKQVIRLWIAEGFVEERVASTFEEVAEGYLKELIQKNMLQLVETNSSGRMKEFRMHSMLRELAVELCQKNCFGVTYEDTREAWHDAHEYRLVLPKLSKEIEESISSVHRLRTIIAVDDTMPSFTLLPMLCKKSIYMTVLELRGLSVEEIPDAIGDLFNLRHLGLRDSKVKVLPGSVEKLSNLLTLDLAGSDIHELPRGIVKLKKLRHLFAEKINNSNWREFQCCSGMCIPNGLGNLTNLQALKALEAQDGSVGHLGELRQLRSLRLCNVKGIHCAGISESLTQMQYLSNLDVNASDVNEVLSLNLLLRNLQKLYLRGRLAEGALGEFPLLQGVEGHNLYSLALFWSQLSADPLPSLSRLSNLTRLHFTRAYNGEQLTFLTGWFPKLKVLCLRDLTNLNRLQIQQGAMESLEELFLVNLNKMTEVPPGIEFLMALQYLGFYEITTDFFSSLCQCSAIEGTKWLYTLRQ